MASDDVLASDAGGLFPRLQERYGLGQDPLSMDVPFFGGAQRQYALDTIRHLAAFGDLMLLLTGERGSGKTRVLAELVRSESEKLSFHRFSVSQVTSEQALADLLLRIAHQGLGAGKSARDAIFGFFRWSETSTRKGNRLVLLFDDADQMPSAVLHILLAAHRGADCSQCVVPVFSGSDKLVASLGLSGDSGAYQERVHQVHLRPLTREELAEYLRPRVERANGDASQLLSSSRLKQLHELSQGSFGRLKRIAPAVWLDMAGHQPAPAKVAGKGVMRGLLWPVSGLILLGLSWFIVSSQYDSTVATNQVDPSPVVVPERKTIRLGPAVEDQSAKESLAAPIAPESGPDPAVSPNQAPVERVVSDSEVAEPAAPVPDTSTAPDDSAELATAPIETDAKPEPPQPATAKPSAESVADAPKKDAVKPVETAPDAMAEKKAKEPKAPQVQGVSAARPDRFLPIAQVRKRKGLTAQFIAGYEEQTVLNFLDQYPEVDALTYTRSTRKGKPWYVVFYGQFDDRAQADRELGALPGKLGRQEPWVRAFSGF